MQCSSAATCKSIIRLTRIDQYSSAFQPSVLKAKRTEKCTDFGLISPIVSMLNPLRFRGSIVDVPRVLRNNIVHPIKVCTMLSTECLNFPINSPVSVIQKIPLKIMKN